MILLVNVLFVLLTYLIESLVSPEYNVVYVEWDKYSILVFFILQQHIKYALSSTKRKEVH